VIEMAGRYLCNYLCWRAAEAARAGAPRITCFIHVPPAQRTLMHWPRPPRFSFDELADAEEAIVRAVVMAVRSFI
jgi:pyroglutamyl-peptidase